MKVICTQENFKKAIYNCERVVAKQTTLPILNNILIETKKSGLLFSATNLEIGTQVKIGSKNEKEGKITIPSKLISTFVNNLPQEENITLETSGDSLKIQCGKSKALIKGLPVSDFPLIPQKSSEIMFFFHGEDLKKILPKIMTSLALNEARQELTGMNLILTEKDVFFASTDSFRLAECSIKLNEKNRSSEDVLNAYIKEKNNIIIPGNTVSELNRVLSQEENSEVKITIEESQIFFEVDGTSIVSRLINGKYPEYKHILPKDFSTRIVGVKSMIQGAVKMASIFSSGKNSEIVLKIDSKTGKILIESKSVEVGENVTELNFDVSGPSQEVIFNSKYLLDGINSISTSQLAVLLNSESTPVALKEIDEKTGEILSDFIYIVMPIKN
jgi:DNA polymerase III subunit beta